METATEKKQLPKEIIHVIRKGNKTRRRKGYIVLSCNGSDTVSIGFSLCHDDTFSGEKGIEIARKRAIRWEGKYEYRIKENMKSTVCHYPIAPEKVPILYENPVTHLMCSRPYDQIVLPSSLLLPLKLFLKQVQERYNCNQVKFPKWIETM